jgi:hypothetical protein
MNDHPIATREQWLAARLDLLEAEKEFTRQRDALIVAAAAVADAGRCFRAWTQRVYVVADLAPGANTRSASTTT